MSIEHYLLKSMEAKDGRTLHSLIADAGADRELSATQVAIVRRSIYTRFTQLNAATVGVQTPRWK